MFHFIVNSKNYPEVAGPNALRLAEAVQIASSTGDMSRTLLYLAAPAFSISEIVARFPDQRILAQHLDLSEAGSTTGHLAPEVAKLSGARGSLLNHSEHRIPKDKIRSLVKTLRELGLTSVVCARDAAEVAEFTAYGPNFVAIEPPELIGSGRAVSKVKPELITDSLSSMKGALNEGQSTILLCGAGIVDEADVRRSVELGAEGILVASSVIKAEDWVTKILSLAKGFKK